MLAVFFSLAYFASPAQAAINQQINFQGKLTNPDGTNVTNGTYSIRFRIYNHATNDAANSCSANSCLWEETQGSVSVTDGNFQVALGSVNTALATSVDFNTTPLYLGIKVSSDSEMTPRIQFTAAPYAFNSEKLGGVTSAGYVQLGQSASAQTDSSTNPSVFINKTGGSGNIFQLQKTASDVFVIGNTGNITATGTYNSNTFTSTALQFTAASTVSTSAGILTVQGFGGTTVTTPNATGATNATAINTGNSTTAGATGAITVATGNATSGTAGNISLDVGTSSTGNGSILIGTAARAQTITVGNSNASTTIALTAGNGITLNNNTSVAAGRNVTYAAGAGTFDQSSSTGTFKTGTGNVSLNGATAVTTTTAGTVTLTTTNAPGVSSGTTTMTASNGATTFTTSATASISAGDYIVPTTTTGQARMVSGGSGTSFTVSSRFTGAVTGETFTIYRPVNMLNSSANNVGMRINAAGSTTDALQIYSAVATSVVAAFDNAGDLYLGSSSVSGSVSTPSQTGATTDILLTTGDSTTSGNTGIVTVQSGDATSGTSGNVNIDNGVSSTGSPQVNIGTTNSRAITIGNTTSATTVAISVGTGTAAFKLQGASSAVYAQLDTTNNRLYVGNPTADGTAFLLVLDSKNTTGDPTGVNGGQYYNSTNNKFRCYQNSVWADCTTGFNTITKTADQAATQSSTTMQNDNTLLFPVAANGVYVFDALIPVDDSNTTADIKYTLTTPAGATFNAYTTGNATACAISTSGTACTVTTNLTTMLISIRGTIVVGGTAGNVQFQFAQSTAAAASFPVIKKGAVLNWRQSF